MRTRFDPLAQKVPPHITLLDPEPKAKIQNDYLKKLSLDTLPKLNELTFEKVVIHSSVYLWLMPSSESAERLRIWRDALAQGLPPQPDQTGAPKAPQEEFIPHITLGYLSRDLSAEETLSMAREKLKLPVTLVFAKLLLEEFGDNQVSIQIDSWPL